jgi:hydrogenase nickel incorporation protein HypB
MLRENDRLAAALRTEFDRRGLLCLNLISAPGSGKTALLERTLRTLPPGTRAAVLTGDIQTESDARRIARTGYPVTQVATGGACRFDARMVTHALTDVDIDHLDLLFIENVGSLCPLNVDIGEHARVVLLSVTEGEDKPVKYPSVYRRAALAIFTKADLLRHVEFDVASARQYAQQVHPGLRSILTSSRTGEGMRAWHQWIVARRAAVVPVELA